MSVHVVATGGTITSHLEDGVWRNVSARELFGELGGELAALPVHEVAAGPSSNLSVDDMVRIAGHVDAAFADGASGVVVVHGTDTMELTAYVTHLLRAGDGDGRPVVFTGSMRVHSHPDPDGPRNLRDAVAVADSSGVGGVVVCMNGEVHAAPWVLKRSAATVAAFHSFPSGPVATVVGGAPVLVGGDQPWPSVAGSRAIGFADDVGLVTCHPGMSADEVERVADGRRGLVVEGFGDLNLPLEVWGAIASLARRDLLVVVSSRVFTPTSLLDGLDLPGVVGAGGLSTHKAVLLARAALGSTADRDGAAAFVRSHALRHDPGEEAV